jgi:hypothetical protein
MTRTFKTLSLSLPPGIVEELAMLGKATGRVAARVAAEIVLREIAKAPAPREETRRTSWCCTARVVPIQGALVMPESALGDRRWVPVIALLCAACKKQMHGREYEGWIADA